MLGMLTTWMVIMKKYDTLLTLEHMGRETETTHVGS
jgi:hypothetical protein